MKVKRTIPQLIAVTKNEFNLDLLKEMLEIALKLEFMTIPPYLCALWSILDNTHQAYSTIKDHIAQEEMLHMGLVCNLLVALGEKPNLVLGHPSYPDSLPGLTPEVGPIELQPLSRAALELFLEIEYPMNGPIDIANDLEKTSRFLKPETLITASTIGEFYTQIERVFVDLNNRGILPEFDMEHQLEWSFGNSAQVGVLCKIEDIQGVHKAIELIKRQGEGSSGSPEDTGIDDLAHYYRFLEISEEHNIVPVPGTPNQFQYDSQLVPFPNVRPMRPITEEPDGDYSNVSDPVAVEKMRFFDKKYTEMLLQLEAAWSSSTEGARYLSAAVVTMRDLSTTAIELMELNIPGSDQTYGPYFRVQEGVELPPLDGIDGEFPLVQDPTWEDNIQYFFTDQDKACMMIAGREPIDLGSYSQVVENADDILERVSKPEGDRELMPPGARWHQNKIDTFDNWINNGTPEG